MQGKAKCNTLKAIRKDIAEKNEIEWSETECHHTGPCMGTCPKCEGEVRRLEAELEKKRSMGKTVAVAGVSAAVLATMTACTPMDVVDWVQNQLNPQVNGGIEMIQGEVPMETESDCETCVQELEGDVVIETDGTVNVN